MTTPHKWAKEIKAWADGETIQTRSPCQLEWYDSPSPGWVPHWEYRIKPKKQTFWFNVYRGQRDRPRAGPGYSSQKEADASASSFRLACVPVEIEMPE